MHKPATSRTRIATTTAPAAIGPYSQAIMAGDVLYCSGQVPLDPATGALVNATVEAEAEQALQNLGGVLKAAGLGFDCVVRCTVYMTDMADYAAINEVYARYFSADMPPAREAVQVSALPRGARVEISCIAVR